MLPAVGGAGTGVTSEVGTTMGNAPRGAGGGVGQATWAKAAEGPWKTIHVDITPKPTGQAKIAAKRHAFLRVYWCRLGCCSGIWVPEGY